MYIYIYIYILETYGRGRDSHEIKKINLYQ